LLFVLCSLMPLSLSWCPHTHMYPFIQSILLIIHHLYHQTIAFCSYRTFPRFRYLAVIFHFAYMYLPSYSGRASHAHTAPPPDPLHTNMRMCPSVLLRSTWPLFQSMRVLTVHLRVHSPEHDTSPSWNAWPILYIDSFLVYARPPLLYNDSSGIPVVYTSAKRPINYNVIYYISSITSMRNELVELIHKLITNPIIFQE
jgi:hypothetical protein